jgi:hypothetical protein
MEALYSLSGVTPGLDPGDEASDEVTPGVAGVADGSTASA